MKLINEHWVKAHVHPRNTNGHKKNFGHLLVVAGSEGTAGASILCARAALKSGCGMVTVMIPSLAVQILLQEAPELMYLPQGDLSVYDLSKYDAIAIGPGMGFSDQAISNVKYVIAHFKGPVVFDADAISIISNFPSQLMPNHIITPHPGEFSRIQGFAYDEQNREEQASNFVEKYLSTLVLKGPKTLVAGHEIELMQNTTGNDGMATAGSGDVLTGIIASLCAQGYGTFDAAALGVYIHGMAGDNAIKEISKAGLVASDLVRYLAKSCILD
jgi:NAD(P)H-hydrate epimerase